MSIFRIMRSQISFVFSQAKIAFTSKPDAFHQNLGLLKTQLERTTADDVNLNPDLMSEELWKKPKKAPVTYIDIHEDDTLTLGIFVLKPSMKLPLHSHPHMHGLIKVIAGKVKITSYSLNTPNTKRITLSESQLNGRSSRQLVAEKCPDVYLDKDSNCCLLDPNNKNLHEIESVDGPAAFIDILSPPYETQIEGNGLRHCRYYKVVSEIQPGIVQMQEITSPGWYWTDSYQYNGPACH